MVWAKDHTLDIVVDFDGTVVAFDFPQVGKSIGAEQVLKDLINKGHRLILSTMRDGKHLAEAINWFVDKNISLYGIQTNPTQKEWTTSPKCHGHLFIDDLGLGMPLITDESLSSKPFVDWLIVRKMLVQRGIL